MKLLDPARGPEMTRSDWARFAAAYVVGMVVTTLAVMVLDFFLSGLRRPHVGIPTFAVVFGMFYPLSIAFGDKTHPPRSAPLYVIKVMIALAILGALMIGLVEAFTRWDGGWQGAVMIAAIGAVLYPLISVAAHKHAYDRAHRSDAEPHLRP